jgi:hypothetical protein
MLRYVGGPGMGTFDDRPSQRAPLRGEFGMVREGFSTNHHSANILEYTCMDVHGAIPSIAMLDS